MIELVLIDKASEVNGGEEVTYDTDNPSRGETTDRSCSDSEKDDTCYQ